MSSHPYRFLGRRLFNWLRRSFSFLWLVIVAGYLSVQAGQAVYGNYQSLQHTQSLREQLTQLQQEKTRLEALLVYYQTDSFKEKELRLNLLMKKPDEKLYALPESSNSKNEDDPAVLTDQPASASSGSQPAKPSSDPVWKQWVQYIWQS